MQIHLMFQMGGSMGRIHLALSRGAISASWNWVGRDGGKIKGEKPQAKTATVEEGIGPVISAPP